MKKPLSNKSFFVHSNEYGKLEIIKFFIFGLHYWTEINKAYTHFDDERVN